MIVDAGCLAGLFCLLAAGRMQAEDAAAPARAEDGAEMTKGKLRLALCQFPVCADPKVNGDWVRRQMREAAAQHADVAHFCECALAGYPAKDHKTLDGFDWGVLRAETEKVLATARELKLWVILGSIHRLTGDHKPLNSLYVISPEGRIIDRYDKRFCTSGDLKHFSPGDHFVTFEINGVKCGLLICYDVRFPELYREYYKLGVQLVFQSFYNARQKEGSIHPIIMPITSQARAATNYMFVSLTNSSAPCAWPCHLITPDGLIEAKLPVDEPAVEVRLVDTTKSYYDASRPYRIDAINGKLNSGDTVDDPRAKDRTGY